MKRFVFAFAFVLWVHSSFAQNTPLPEREVGKRGVLPTRKRVLSVEFIAPLFRHFTVGHEMELRKDISWETKVGVIFPNAVSSTSDFNYQQQGGFIRTGIKFYRNFPQNRWRFWGNNNDRERNVFEGRYIKPEIVVGYFSEKDPDSPLRSNNTFASAILLNFGRQYVFAKRLTLGYEWGLGYAFSNEDMNRINTPNAKNYRPYGWYYSHVGAPNSDFPIAFSVGFNVGVVLGRY
jgi:hypothetical protein